MFTIYCDRIDIIVICLTDIKVLNFFPFFALVLSISHAKTNDVDAIASTIATLINVSWFSPNLASLERPLSSAFA